MNDDNEKITEEDLHFHYNREDRIKRAPSIVRSHYDGSEKLPPKGFFKSLVHTKSSRFLLGSIVLLVIMILFAVNIDIDKKSATILSIPFELNAFLYDETVYVTLTASETSVANDLEVSVYFSALNEQDIVQEQSSIHSIFDGNENFYRTTFTKYDILLIECDISLGDEMVQLRTKVQK